MCPLTMAPTTTDDDDNNQNTTTIEINILQQQHNGVRERARKNYFAKRTLHR